MQAPVTRCGLPLLAASAVPLLLPVLPVSSHSISLTLSFKHSALHGRTPTNNINNDLLDYVGAAPASA